jgi:tetratricopeptide (TPR) repeat protein
MSNPYLKSWAALTLCLLPLTGQAQQPSAEELELRKRAEAMLRSATERRQIRREASREQAMFQYLLSEIASQRGQSALAIDGMIDLARRTGDARLARRAVEIGFQQNNRPKAMEAATLWLTLEPKSDLARQAMAVLLVNQGSLEAAKDSLKGFLADKDKAPAIYLELNALLARFPDRAAVLATIRELAALQPQLPHSAMAVAIALASQRETVGAMEEARRALAIAPTFQPAAILIGQILRESAPEQARPHFESFLAANPGANEVRLAFARHLVSERHYDAAFLQYEQLAAALPGDPEIPYAQGLLALQTQRLDVAEAALRKTLSMQLRDRNPVLMSLGQVEEARKNWEAALDWYRLVEGDEHFVNSRIRMAAVMVKIGGLDAARKFLRDSGDDLGPQAVQMILAESQLLRDAKQHREALAVLTMGLIRFPDNIDLLYDRSMVREKLDDVAGMEKDLREVIRLKPDHAHAYNALGYSFADRNIRLPEALELIRKAVALSPRDGFILDSLGWVHYRMNQLPEALDALRKAYALRNDPEIAAHLGEVLLATGQADEARKILEATRAAHPDSPVLEAVLRKLDTKP